MKKDIQSKKPELKLHAFDSYDHYLRYAKNLFDLTDQEYKLLYQVLLKLQNVGQDPIEAMRDCKSKMEEHDCLGMLRLMMTIEEMDLEQINMSA